MTKQKKRATKKPITTHEKFIKSMTTQQKREYEEGYRDFLLSELLLAIMKDDAISVRKLAKKTEFFHLNQYQGKFSSNY